VTLEELRQERERQVWRAAELKAELYDVTQAIAFLDAQIATEERALQERQKGEAAARSGRRAGGPGQGE
jgi:hypothetical protein